MIDFDKCLEFVDNLLKILLKLIHSQRFYCTYGLDGQKGDHHQQAQLEYILSNF